MKRGTTAKRAKRAKEALNRRSGVAGQGEYRRRQAAGVRATEVRQDIISIGDNLEEMKQLVSAVKMSAKRLQSGPAGKSGKSIFGLMANAERSIIQADNIAERMIKQYAQLG